MRNLRRHSGTSDRVTTRRLHLRRRLSSLAYCEINEGSRGIVFNLGEGGLSVRSSTVLVEQRLPRINFQLPRSGTWINLSGKIAWIDESHKEAGIQFIDLPETARIEIREWVSAGPSAAELPEEITSARERVNPIHVSLMLALAVISLGLMWIAFSRYAVPPIIESAYRGESSPIFNRMISGQASHPVAEYLSDWDRLGWLVLAEFCLVGLLVLLVVRLEPQRWPLQFLALGIAGYVLLWIAILKGYPVVYADIAIACAALAWFRPLLGDRLLGAVERFGVNLAEKRGLAILLMASAVILLRLSLLWRVPVPVPQVHDEFSYLLSADTFAHGRLTNPVHPMWIFFDTFHVNQRPTYMSKYPPAQGVVLALGQLLGHPWIGVLLSVSAMCAAILWMLQGWVPPRWALLGATLASLQIGLLTYWMNSYWGGAVAAVGGALVMGALPRIFHRQRPRDAILLGLGVGILANSRPYEGLVLCLPVAVALVWWIVSERGPSWRITVPRVVVPITAVLLVAGAFMCYYNWRGTGNPFLFPYQVNDRTYLSAPLFIWQRLRPPLHYSNPQFEAFYNHMFNGTWQDAVRLSWEKIAHLQDAFLSWEPELSLPLLALPWLLRDGKLRLLTAQVVFSLLGILAVVLFHPQYAVRAAATMPLLGLPWLLRDRQMRFLVLQFAFSVLGFLPVVWFNRHYAAPVMATFLALLVQAMRYLRRWQHRGRPVGIGLSRVVVLFSVGMILVQVALWKSNRSWSYADTPWEWSRARIVVQLEATPGEHLVIVRYSPEHSPHREWVYNRADIDRAKVVWAREIPGVNLQPLLDYFRGRQVWLLEADAHPPRLSAYRPIAKP